MPMTTGSGGKWSTTVAEREAEIRELAETEVGPWPNRCLFLLAELSLLRGRVEQAERQLEAVDDALPPWESERPDRFAVGRVQTILNLKDDRARVEQAEKALQRIDRLDFSGTWQEVAEWCQRTARLAVHEHTDECDRENDRREAMGAFPLCTCLAARAAVSAAPEEQE